MRKCSGNKFEKWKLVRYPTLYAQIAGLWLKPVASVFPADCYEERSIFQR